MLNKQLNAYVVLERGIERPGAPEHDVCDPNRSHLLHTCLITWAHTHNTDMVRHTGEEEDNDLACG